MEMVGETLSKICNLEAILQLCAKEYMLLFCFIMQKYDGLVFMFNFLQQPHFQT